MVKIKKTETQPPLNKAHKTLRLGQEISEDRFSKVLSVDEMRVTLDVP
ncbi:unnamed protein product, partial [Staurois parvus]